MLNKTPQEIKKMINASPFYKHMGLKAIKIEDTGSEVIMDIQKPLLNIIEITHGGAIASLADTTASLALIPFLKKNESAVTQKLDVNFLKSSKKGILNSKGKLLSRGRHSAVLEANVFDESGEVIAHAHTIHIIQKMG